MKADLKDVTFLLIVRLDSIERLENILTVTKFLVSNFSTTIRVYESSSFQNNILKRLLNKEIEYFFIEDDDPILHRTRLINKASLNVTTSIISIWDTDVIAPKEQIIGAIKKLRDDTYDLVYPYRNKLLDTSFVLRKLFFKTKNINILLKNETKMKEMYPPEAVGGAFICKLDKYIEVGLENELFYGWGIEDGERYVRWKELDYRIGRVDGCLFHFSHGRGINSVFHQPYESTLKMKILEASAREALLKKRQNVNEK